MAAVDYNARVRELFAAPRHAGAVADGACAEAARGGMRVLLSGRASGGRIAALRYRVFGCPHLIAATEAWCRAAEGAALAALEAPELAAIRAELEIPVAKTGRILLLEDTIRALHGRLVAPGKLED